MVAPTGAKVTTGLRLCLQGRVRRFGSVCEEGNLAPVTIVDVRPTGSIWTEILPLSQPHTHWPCPEGAGHRGALQCQRNPHKASRCPAYALFCPFLRSRTTWLLFLQL